MLLATHARLPKVVLLHPVDGVPVRSVHETPIAVRRGEIVDGHRHIPPGTEPGLHQAIRAEAVRARIVDRRRFDVRRDVIRDEFRDLADREVLESRRCRRRPIAARARTDRDRPNRRCECLVGFVNRRTRSSGPSSAPAWSTALTVRSSRMRGEYPQTVAGRRIVVTIALP